MFSREPSHLLMFPCCKANASTAHDSLNAYSPFSTPKFHLQRIYCTWSRGRRASRALVEKRESTSRGHVPDDFDGENDPHFFVATRQCSTSTCRMHLNLFSIPITIIYDNICDSISDAHRPGALQKGPVRLPLGGQKAAQHLFGRCSIGLPWPHKC